MTPEQIGPASDGGAAINGVRLDRVAAIVSSKPPLDATAEEWRIARVTIAYGERLEREGYMPQFRRPAMLRRMAEEARRA